MNKFKMALTWHNCKYCPPSEAYNHLLVITDGYNVDYCSYYKTYGFPIDESELHKYWWSDLAKTVREYTEFKELG